MTETKDYSRSLRMTQTTKEAVERQIGNGFNEKFENMVARCLFEEPELDRRIKEKRAEITKLEKKIRSLTGVSNELSQIKYMIEDIEKKVKGVASAEM